MVATYVQRQHKERAKLLNFAKVTMANLYIRQCFPRQIPKPTDSPKFYLAKVLRYTVYKDAWTSSIGETLDCEHEAAKYHDP